MSLFITRTTRCTPVLRSTLHLAPRPPVSAQYSVSFPAGLNKAAAVVDVTPQSLQIGGACLLALRCLMSLGVLLTSFSSSLAGSIATAESLRPLLAGGTAAAAAATPATPKKADAKTESKGEVKGSESKAGKTSSDSKSDSEFTEAERWGYRALVTGFRATRTGTHRSRPSLNQRALVIGLLGLFLLQATLPGWAAFRTRCCPSAVPPSPRRCWRGRSSR